MTVTPLATSLVDDWSRRDVELRSTLVYNAVGVHLAQLLADGKREQITDLFERVATDTRVVALAFCQSGSARRLSSKLMPSSLSCEQIARSDAESFSSVVVNGRRMLVSAFPISTREVNGHFVIVHDFAFADRRGAEARGYMAVLLGGIVLASGVLAVGLVIFLIRHWLWTFKKTISHIARTGVSSSGAMELGPFDKEVRQVLRQLETSRAAFDEDFAPWSKTTLRKIMSAELPGAEIMVVANRQPYIHNFGAVGIELQTPASGLVSALEPIMRACGGTWIAHGSGTADRETVDVHDRIAVPPDGPEYTLRRVWITEDEQDGYYYGLANEGLWPLCHIAFTRPVFRQSDWRMYRAINARFAEAVATEARTANPIVLIQDYHFALLPRMIRERMPEATIIAFWHIPWPNAETFGIFPWKEEVIHGLLGSSIIGFHTQFHCNNFLETVDRFVESRIDRELESIVSRGEKR